MTPLASFLAGAVVGLIVHSLIMARKLARLRDALYLLMPPFSKPLR